MIDLKKSKPLTFNEMLYGFITIVLVLFSLYCMSETLEYSRLPSKQIKYQIIQDEVYSYLSDGKNKSWYLKALSRNTENNKLYWINITAADRYVGYKIHYGDKIIPPNEQYNKIILNLGNLFALLWFTMIVLAFLFSPFIYDECNEYIKNRNK